MFPLKILVVIWFTYKVHIKALMIISKHVINPCECYNRRAFTQLVFLPVSLRYGTATQLCHAAKCLISP